MWSGVGKLDDVGADREGDGEGRLSPFVRVQSGLTRGGVNVLLVIKPILGAC